MRSVAVVGAGAWGTALAVHLAIRAASRPEVTLVPHSAAQADALLAARANERYLPGVALPDALRIVPGTAQVRAVDLVVVATPIASLVEVVRELPGAARETPLAWLSKGFVRDAQGEPALAHRVVAPLWHPAVAVISGPSFAEEVARGMPTAVAVAATDDALASEVAALVRGETLRAYESADIIGVEVAGAVKNVLAIAAGACDGLGFGHNARAALVTRGLAEMARLAEAMGGRRETMMGLAGLGDLVLTCTGDLSRNRRVGLALAQGGSLPGILRELGHVAEGVDAARAARALAQRLGVEMPISEAVDRVLHEGLPVRVAVESLLRREPRSEMQ